MLADTKPVQIQRQLIDASKIEKRPVSHIMSNFFYIIGLFVSPHNKHKGKGMWFDSDSSHLWEERCVTTLLKNSCEQINVWLKHILQTKKGSLPFLPNPKKYRAAAQILVGNNKQAHNQGSKWFCGWVKERVYIVLFSKQYTTSCQYANNFVADSY